MSAGHIRRRGKCSWEVKIELGTDPLTGKRRIKYHSVKGSRKDAQAELVRLMSGVNAGTYVDTAKSTLAEFLDRWETDWAAINVGPKTLERYRELLRVHVRPNVGAIPVQKLQAAHLAELYARLLREGRGRSGKKPTALSARTVGHVHRVLHKALAVAVQWGVVSRNVASMATPPKVSGDGETEILTEEQARTLLQRLRGRSLYMVALLGLSTGCRRGELLALRWKDVDLDGGTLRIEQSIEQTKAGLRFKAPKTRHGRRTIALAPSVVAELRQHRKKQLEERLRLGMGKIPDDGLVLARWDGKPRSPNAVTKEWTRALAEFGMPAVSLHALRHTHASQLIASGLDVLTISRRLGHGSPTITLSVYVHKFRNKDEQAAQYGERLWQRPSNRLRTVRWQSGGNSHFSRVRSLVKRLRYKAGRVAEWFKAPVLKTGRGRNVPRGFESHPFRHRPHSLSFAAVRQ
jgi:integrase